MTNTSRQYALALFSLAEEAKQIDEIYQEFHAFLQGFEALTWKFFLNPKIEDADKKQVIEKTINNPLLIRFFKIVIDNNRFDHTEDMLESYKALINASQNIAELMVYTNQALTKTNKSKLKKKFEQQLNKKIIINEVIRPSIIGGIRVEYDGKVLDQTIDASLEDLKSSLMG